ncbi:tyrosine-type recombinase/integrase [Nostocaceae cyanobacterium CENA369]|uniref:Tyrosine-type recombinase/integrase n=1 Tax=Dendronalium phyllosphericum CENA369 TaxID=1725256 RepID=A0A8J7IB67_9NOST|nr:tyrosine-type recombinase/integrase [Dendronalium phyllosphericum]MBH8576953.1 tyrosine-type recombinase/integrase [Dendronalium phyllosphericum CENA369]
MKRNKRGTVGIEVKQGKLRLRLPRTIADVNARYISTGLDDTPDNRRKVQLKAWELEEDIQKGTLDQTLTRYKFQQQPVISTKPKTVPNLRELWLAYCEYRRPIVATTTFVQKYLGYYTNHINRLPSYNPNDAAYIRHYLITTYTNDTVKRLLIQLNACCKWSVSAGLIDDNPFVGMANELKQQWSVENIDPFNRDERDAIIEAYRKHPKYKHYYNFIRFLFITGCRPGEACALRWCNVSDEFILFCESYSVRYKLVKDTKTHKPRRFPCNTMLRELLQSLKKNENEPDSLVFTTHYHGQTINNDTIPTALGWKLIVNGLVTEGKVQRYRPPYNCRHTFITLALNAGLTVSQVAKLVGNTPAVILKHYASGHVSEVPVF